MNKAPLFQARWNVSGLLLCNSIPIVLLCFWLWPIGHHLCTAFDEWLFRLLNTPLASSAAWRYVWTLGSLRPFDIVVGVIMLALLIRGNWVFKAGQVRQAFFGFMAVLLLLVVVRALFSKWIHAMGWDHDSPSMVLTDPVLLSDWYPDLERHWELKDRSSQSFPGDHASVLLIWALFMSVCTRRIGQWLCIWALALVFMLPRLVAGAHWGQDDYIGGVLMAVWALGWGYFTPFAAHTSQWLVRVTEPLFRLLAKLPVLGRLSIVAG